MKHIIVKYAFKRYWVKYTWEYELNLSEIKEQIERKEMVEVILEVNE